MYTDMHSFISSYPVSKSVTTDWFPSSSSAFSSTMSYAPLGGLGDDDDDGG